MMIGGNLLERLALSLPTDAAAKRLLRKGVEYVKANHACNSELGAGGNVGSPSNAATRLPPNRVDDRGESCGSPLISKLDKDGWPKRWSDPNYLGDGPWGA